MRPKESCPTGNQNSLHFTSTRLGYRFELA
jgi:hypothetical protein